MAISQAIQQSKYIVTAKKTPMLSAAQWFTGGAADFTGAASDVGGGVLSDRRAAAGEGPSEQSLSGFESRGGGPTGAVDGWHQIEMVGWVFVWFSLVEILNR